MGLLDDLLGGKAAGLVTQALGAVKPGQPAANVNSQQLVESVLALVNNPNTGGLAGLVKSFTSAGLGQQINSWVSTGANLPVSAEQVRQALGNPQLQELAAKLGVTHDSVSNALAHVLPAVVDKLTPNGQIPHAAELQQGLNLLQQVLRR